MRVISSFILTISVLGMHTTSCQHEPELIPGTTEVCFDTQVLPIIQSSCAMSGCHDGNEEFALKTFDNIRKHVDEGKPAQSKIHKVITASTISGKLMPPKPYEPLSSAQIDIISLWILQGAKQTQCNNIACDTVNVTFSGTILPLTDTYCKGCHNNPNPKGGVVLNDYTTIKASVTNGHFMGSVQHLSGFKPMPEGGKLPDCNIIQLKKWISYGMPNN